MDDRMTLPEPRPNERGRLAGVGVLCTVAIIAGLDTDGPLKELGAFVTRLTQSSPVTSPETRTASIWPPAAAGQGQSPHGSEPVGPTISQVSYQDPNSPQPPAPADATNADAQNDDEPPRLPDLEPNAPRLPVDENTVEDRDNGVNETETRVRVPINDLNRQVQISGGGDQISLQVNGAPVNDVLALIAQQHGLNVVAAAEVTGNISVNLTNARLEDALDAILRVNGYTWSRQKNIILVTSISSNSTAPPGTQGQELRIFPLTWVSGDDIDAVVTGLLSPVGKSFARVTETGDNRKTQEQIVVEDLPTNIARIASYIQQIDHAPRQVQIEVHVLSVLLNDDTRHGVNFDAMLKLANADVTLATPGFANAAANPAFVFGLNSTDLDSVIEALQTTNDAKTLASPKVMAVNGQQARIQIGERLGYRVVTTTQTSTQEDVNFLETGIVMTVTPVIGDDGQIMLTVMPKISDGRINPATSLPEEETTDVATTVVLRDGHAMVIGGLIDETDSEVQTKIPIAGDLWGVGRFFQRRQTVRTRREIIITLIPRLVPYDPEYSSIEQTNVVRSTTPLLDWPLNRFPRPFEPDIPDAVENPRTIRFDRLFGSLHDLKDEKPHSADYFFPSKLDPWYYDLHE